MPKLLGVTLGLLLTSCADQTPSPAPDSFCLIAAPITFDRLHDTLPTIAQIKAHNAVFEKLCGQAGDQKPAVWGIGHWGDPGL